MKDFATENQARDDLSAKPSTVELQAGDGPVTAYVLLSREPEEFNSAAQSVSFGSMELSSAKVYADEAEAIGFAEVTGAKLEKVEIPGGLARDVFLKKWMKAAKKNKQGLLPFLLLPLAACGGGGGGPVTFTVTEAANLISFGGTATGDITTSTVGGTTTFTRGGLTDTATGVFAGGAPKQIIAAAGQTVIVTGAQIAGPNELLASGAGNVTINATDAGAGTVTTVSTKINVALTGGTLTFDMSNDNEDTITLTAGSVINLGGGTLVVSDGKVNASGVAISNVSGVTLNSTLVVDLADFKEIQDAGGFTGTGTLEVNPSASDTVTNTTNLGTGGVGVAAGAINNAEFTEAEYLALFIGGIGGNANAVGNLATLAANSVTITGSVSNTTVLASLETNAAKIAAGGVTAITLANDAAVNTFDGLIANAGVAANSVTVTNGTITSAGAKAAIVASVAKFKADQIDSITLTDAEAAVTGFLADDAFNANSVTIGAVTTSEAAVLANGREIANNGITAITITAAEFDTFIDANTNAPFQDESVTLGDVTTNQADVVTNIAKVVDGGITSITLTAAQFVTIVTGGVNSLDALQTHSVTISDPANMILAGAVTQAEVQVGLALNVKGSVTLDASAVTAATASHAELMSLYAANAAGTISGLGNENLVANDGGISVSEANNLAAKTSGTLTASLSDTVLANYAGLEGTGNVYTISIADAAIDADALVALNAKTTGTITLAGDTSISGTLANVNTVLGGAGLASVAANLAITVTDASITVAEADALSELTTGLVTATVAPGTLAANNAFADSGGQVNNISFTVTDSTAAAATLNALDAKTTVDIDVSAANAISGAHADIVTLYGNTANFVSLGNENITATDATITIAEANALAALTTGTITAQIAAGTANALATGVNGTGNAYTLDVSDGANVDAADLLALNGKTTVAVDLQLITAAGTALNGNYAELKTLFAAAASGDYTGLAGNLPITIDDNVSVSQANEINALTSAAVTAGISDTVLANYAGLEGTGNVYTISIADAAIDADALVALNAKTTGTITLAGDTSISGTLANVNTVLGGAGLASVAANLAITVTDASITVAEADALSELTTGLVTATVAPGTLAANNAFADSGGQVNNISFTVTDSTAAAATLNALDAKTTVDIDVSAANAISGAHADIVTLYGNTANFVSLGNENITATDATITIAEANALAALTTGTITAQIAAGTANALATGVNGTGNAYTLDVSDGANVDAADLLALNGKTTVAVDLQLITAAGTALNGNYAELKTLFAAAASGDYTGLAGNLPITIDDNVSVSQANEINALTSAAVTAGISDTVLANYAGLEGTGNVYTISIADAAIDADALVALNAKTTGTITLAGDTSISGTLANVNTVLGGAGLASVAANLAITVTDASITVAEADALSELTTGLVTATVAPGTLAANNAFADSGGQVNNISFTVTDSTAAAATLNALDAKTTVDIDVSAANAISGAHADIVTLYGNTANFVSLGNENITATDATITIAEANALAALTTGTITAQIAAGTANALATGVNGTGNAYTLDVSDGANVDAADLLALNGKTTVAVDLQLITAAGTALNGNYAELKTLFAAAASGDYTGLAGNLPITIDDNVSVSQANEINALTSAAVTATISTGDMVTLNGLEGTGNVYAITVADVSGDMGELNALNAKTTGVLTVGAVNTLTGTNAELTTMLGGQALTTNASGFTGFNAAEAIVLSDASVTALQADVASQASAGLLTATVAPDALATLNTNFADSGGQVNNISFTVTDSTAVAATLNALDAKTTVDIDVSAANAISGANADIVTLYGNTANFVGLGNENITATDASITVAQAVTLLGFTSGSLTGTITAAGATTTQLASLAAFDSQIAGTITNLSLGITALTAAQSRSAQFDGLTDTQAQALFNHAAGGVTVTGNAGADWIDLRGFNTTGVDFTINALAGDNKIYSGDGNDTITTTTGADFINVGGGRDTVNAGAGIDQIEVDSLDNVDGSVYDGEGDNDTLTVKGINDLTNTVQTSLETLDLQPGSPSEVTLTGSQAEAYGTISGTAGNSKLIIQVEMASVTYAGAGAKLDGGGTDTVTFTYQGAAKTVTGNFSTLAELQTAVDAQVGGAGNVFASLTNGNADVTLTVKALGETITAPGYANNGGGNVAGAAAAEDAAVDMSGVIFQNLAELKADAGVGIALSIANVANIGAVESDNNSVGLDLDGSAISSDLDISAMSLTPASGVVNLTVNSGATFTATAAQVVSTNPAFATTGAGTTKIIGASGTVQNSTLELNANGVVNTTAVIVDVGANMSVTTDALQNVTAFNINAGKTLTIDSDKVSAKTVTGDGAMIVNIGTDNFNLANVAGTVSSSGTVTGNTTLHGSANLGTLTTTVNNGVTLQLLGTQADGKTINGAGAVTVNDLDGDAAADLSKITVAGTKTAKVANNVTFTGDLNGFGVDVAATKTITSTAAKLTGLSVIDSTGNAGITVTDLGTAAFNAANFSVGGALLVKTATSSGANSITLNAATNVVGATAATKTIDITETGDTLVATAAQLDALVVTDTATSNVTVTALGNTDFDASSFSIAGNLLVQTVASGGADTITLGAGTDIVGATAAAKAIDITETGDTLVATAAQLTAATVTDTATSNVTVTALGGTAFDASNFSIAGNLLVKTVASGGADTITLHGTTNILGATTGGTETIDITETGDTLAATAAQLTGATVTDTATSNVTVTALGNTAFNADNFSIAGNLLVQTVSAAGDVTLNASTNIVGATAASKTISITDDDTLTGTAAQLTGVAVTDAGTANVTVTALGNTAFNAAGFSIAGNLLVQTVAAGGDVTLDAATNLFGGTLGGTKTLSITDNGDTLTATAAQLTGAAVTDVGTAHIIVNDLTNAVTFDASNFSTAGNLTVNTKSDAGTSIALTAGAKINNATTGGTETINIVDTGDTLTGTVAQLTGLTITDTAVGNVTATALDGAAAYDFSNVSIDGNLLVQTVASGGSAATITLNGATDIAGATVAAGKTKTINMTEGDVLVATGAQLSGVNVTESANAIVRTSNTTFAANTDLSGVRTNAIEFGAGNNTDLVLGNGVILSLREAHLTNLVGDNGADASIGDGSNTGHVKIYEFTGDSDLVEIDVAGNITGYVSTAQTIVGDEAKIEELDALVIQSGGSLALTQVQANAFATTLTKEAGAGNVTSSVTGDLSALNLSVVDALTLTGATTLVDSTADLKAAAAINAASQAITVNNAIDLTAKTITNYGNLTVDTNQLTVSAEQIAGFTGGGTVAKTNGGLIKVHVGSTTNISGLDTSDASSIVLNTSGSDVTMTTAQNLQVADGVGTNTITLSNNGTTNGVAGIENYILSSAGANSFTLASNTAQVTGGTNNDTIVGGTGASTIIGGQGVDILSGDNGADIFSFSTGHTGITALTADRILDFATGVDQIKINGTKGDVVEADGANMLFSGFTSAATAAFNGGIDIYAAYNVSGSGDTYVAIDHNASGTFNSGDSLIVLNNLNLDNQLVAGDFIA